MPTCRARFTGDQLLRSVEANAELLGVSEYVETMQMRIRTLLSDSRMKTVSGNTQGLTLDDWLPTTSATTRHPTVRSPSSTYRWCLPKWCISSPPLSPA
jgi:hypothetical protein